MNFEYDVFEHKHAITDINNNLICKIIANLSLYKTILFYSRYEYCNSTNNNPIGQFRRLVTYCITLPSHWRSRLRKFCIGLIKSKAPSNGEERQLYRYQSHILDFLNLYTGTRIIIIICNLLTYIRDEQLQG